MSFSNWVPELVALISLFVVVASGFLAARFVVTGLLGRVILAISALSLYVYLLVAFVGVRFVDNPALYGIRAGCMGLAFGLAFLIVRRRSGASLTSHSRGQL